jgi:hypothetical protein
MLAGETVAMDGEVCYSVDVGYPGQLQLRINRKEIKKRTF